MQVVPLGQELVAEVWVENKDIGFVHETTPAEIKIDSFPFTKYGTIDGTIQNISDDAIAHEELGLAFVAQVTLIDSTIDVEGRTVNLIPGMAVTVEMKTGARRVIEFVLSPVLKGLRESARER